MCVHVCACIRLQARGKTSKFEGGAQQPLHKRSCSERTMCTELHSRDWVFSLLGKVGYMCICLETHAHVNWLLCSDENGMHRRTKWYLFCMLSFRVCMHVEVLGCFSQCLLMCEICPCWTVKPPAAFIVKRPWWRSRATTWPVSPLLPYYSRFVEFYINIKFCFIPIKMSHNNLHCSVFFVFFFLAHNVGGTALSRMVGLPTVRADQYQLP